MNKDLQNYQIARFALNTSIANIPSKITDQLKKHLLDAMGSFIWSTQQPTMAKLMNQLIFISEGGKCKAPLLQKGLPYDRAGQLYTALIRYPDFMDNYMGKEATCHPSDNIGALMAVAQMHPTNGEEFLTAMAIAYQIECRLVEEIPVMKEGIDHTLFLAYSITAGIAKLMQLDEEQTANALGIAGSSISPLVTSRASYTFEWKGFASSLEALNCINIALLAERGMTGPVELFEGPKGFKEIFGMNLDFNWSKENFDLVKKCVLKKYNAEVHSQAALEATIELAVKYNIDCDKIKRVEVTTFLTAYHIIGSGAYGDRKTVETKEQADHSLFYLVAVALLDKEVHPVQFEPERIKQPDVQKLLQKIVVQTKFPVHKPILIAGLLDPYTEVYPDKMKARVEITLTNGKEYTCEKEDYYGFFTRPFTWEFTEQKFRKLTQNIIDMDRQKEIIDTIKQLDEKESMDTLINLVTDISL